MLESQEPTTTRPARPRRVTDRLGSANPLTVVGGDRAGLVAALADVVPPFRGRSGQLAELAGTFAGSWSCPSPPIGRVAHHSVATSAIVEDPARGHHATTETSRAVLR